MTGPELPTDPEDAPGGVPGVIAPDVIRRPVRLPGWIQAAAELDGLADWIDSELDDEARDRQYIAETAATAARYIAARIRTTGRVR